MSYEPKKGDRVWLWAVVDRDGVDCDGDVCIRIAGEEGDTVFVGPDDITPEPDTDRIEQKLADGDTSLEYEPQSVAFSPTQPEVGVYQLSGTDPAFFCNPATSTLTDHGRYIGRPANELPPGTVCDVEMMRRTVRVLWDGKRLCDVDGGDKPVDVLICNNHPVIRIHKLGRWPEPERPKTLADEPGVAWESEHGIVRFCWDGQMFLLDHRGEVKKSSCQADIAPYTRWTRLGKVGITIDGEPWGGGE